MPLLERIEALCQQSPSAPMVEVMAMGAGTARRYTRGEVLHAVKVMTHDLAALPSKPTGDDKIGLIMKNSPEWVVADLALMASGRVEVPVPLAFASDQALHLLDGVTHCLVDRAGQARLQEWLAVAPAGTPKPMAHLIELDALLQAPHENTVTAYMPDEQSICKVIHTSGTTSRPKGVRIRHAGLSALMASLQERITPGHYRRYLSLVPLSLLIEQVTAAYMTFLEGGTLVFLPPQQPLLGESGATTRALLPCLAQASVTALTLPPVVVEALLAACRAHQDESLESRCQRLFGHSEPAFIACGGAPTAPAVIAELAAYGIPIYEGYGLSENSSVVAWNAPSCFKAGTVGKPLNHVTVKLSADGELLVKSRSLFAGYAGTDPSSCEVDADGWLHTGDVGAMDDQGFIRVFGRKKNLIITANGRNVSPEWVESRYKSLDCVDQAVVFGDGLACLHGFFVISPDVSIEHATAQIQAFGLGHLSDVERVERVVASKASPDLYERYFTVTGRPKREAIWTHITSQTTTGEDASCLTN